jgi:hypothetical protein
MYQQVRGIAVLVRGDLEAAVFRGAESRVKSTGDCGNDPLLSVAPLHRSMFCAPLRVGRSRLFIADNSCLSVVWVVDRGG